MLTDDFPFLSVRNIRRDVDLDARLLALARDIVRLRTGAAPDGADLAAAPLIDGWNSVVTPLGLRLVGRVVGHPTLGACTAMTTPLWVADHKGRWIRTLSRFYRLGRPRVERARPDARVLGDV